MESLSEFQLWIINGRRLDNICRPVNNNRRKKCTLYRCFWEGKCFKLFGGKIGEKFRISAKQVCEKMRCRTTIIDHRFESFFA
jgi:hypothetical protein